MDLEQWASQRQGVIFLSMWLLLLTGCLATWAVAIWTVVRIVLWLVSK